MSRVLLVEDDPAFVRFFELATEGLGIELNVRATVSEAMDYLKAIAVQLVVTDLMLPVESGLVLLQRLQREPALCGGARLVACSAGITSSVQRELAGLGVWRQLNKPVSVTDLRDCIREGLGLVLHHHSDIGHDKPVPPAVPSAGAHAHADLLAGRDEDAALKRYFAGNRGLFDAFRAACVCQFPEDLRAGDAALVARDHFAFRRVNHSLKSVLLSLGMPQASDCAKRLEEAAARAEWDVAQTQWPRMRAALAMLAFT